jgi:kinesin family member 1
LVLIYNHEKDPLERAVINLQTSQIAYSEDQMEMLQNENTFTVTTNHRGFLIQTLHKKEVFEWLYALNPLLAGEIRSKLARRQSIKQQNTKPLSRKGSD